MKIPNYRGSTVIIYVTQTIYRISGNFQVAKISLFLEDRGVNHIKYLIFVYKLLQIAKIVKISPT